MRPRLVYALLVDAAAVFQQAAQVIALLRRPGFRRLQRSLERLQALDEVVGEHEQRCAGPHEERLRLLP